LSNFCISSPVRDIALWDRLLCSVAPAKKPVATSARVATRTVHYRQPYLEDWIFLPTLPISQSTHHLYLEGNFQAYQYARDLDQSMREEFRFREPAFGRNLDMLEKIRAAKSSVFLHVRRGDYAVRSDGPQLLPLGYYARAIQALSQRVSNPEFFVFSDDIAFARENLPCEKRMVFVDNNDETNPHEDLRLMAACSHSIIANSTLSWWGAWLNPNPTKLVFAPDSWQNVNREVPYPDLIPPNWLRIATDTSLV
jgi:hypothetical protein